jgi:hypothetical protein
MRGLGHARQFASIGTGMRQGLYVASYHGVQLGTALVTAA